MSKKQLLDNVGNFPFLLEPEERNIINGKGLFWEKPAQFVKSTAGLLEEKKVINLNSG